MLSEEEAIKALVYDNVNVTESNPLKELLKIAIQLLIYIVIAYYLIFFIAGICLKNLSDSQQTWLENAISNTLSINTLELSDLEQERLLKIRNLVLENDVNFPKTSALNIGIISNSRMNALCYPNGNIYITDSLYKHLTSDEALTFVIAHEMAHYKNRDHLMNLRKSIASNFVILSIAFSEANATNVDRLVATSLDMADMRYSRRVEALADKYAARISKNIYGNVDGGIHVMQILSKDSDFDKQDFLSTHPSIEKRLSYLKKFD